MDRPRENQTGTETHSARRSPDGRAGGATAQESDLQAAQEKLQKVRDRMLSAAVAFCDGLISAGQLRAVREMLREQELRVAEMEGEEKAPFVEEEAEPASPSPTLPVERIPTTEAAPEDRSLTTPVGTINKELESMLARLDEKLAQLEADFQQGRINASQYRAIRRHYREQHEVALRLHQSNPESDRWRVVLEEGKTSFLMQLNEAECRCIAFYDIDSRQSIYVQGDLPEEADQAMRFLATFGQSPSRATSGRMFATQTDDGTNLLLIPGRHTASLVAFTDEPPGWQVRALREVLRNFEAANDGALQRKQVGSLVFPNLDRFFRD